MFQERYGPWALITGASSGIGAAFARRLAAEGINTALAARSTEQLAAVGHSLTDQHGVEHRVVPVDLTEPDGPSRLLDPVADLEIGMLVSNAGDARPADFLDQTVEALRAQIALNATAHMELVRGLAPAMRTRRSGGIVLTSASGGRHGMPYLANTAAAKGYVHHLGEALHHELRPAGIDVLTLLPGNVDTPLVGRIGLDQLGLPLPLISPERAVDDALRALRRGRSTLVPGRTMRIALRTMPRNLSVRLNGRMLAAARAANQNPVRTGADR